MAFFDDKHVMVTGLVLWDGITSPDTNTQVGKPKHSLKIAVPSNSQDLIDLDQIGRNELNAGDLKGNLPAGAHWITKAVQPGEFGDQLQGYNVVNAGTYNGQPQVFDINGNELNSMQFANSFYPGAKVTVLVHAYTINNAQKGVVCGLDGVQIVDTTLPRLNIGGGGVDASKAFGGGGGAQPQPQPQPAAQPQPQPQPAAQPQPQPQPQPAAQPQPQPQPTPAHDIVDGPGAAEQQYNIGGTLYTHSQLLGFGWTEQQIAQQATPA